MSMIVTTVVPDGIVMAADSALAAFKMVDMRNFIKGNVSEAMANTAQGTCAHEKENIVGNTILSNSVRKLHVMKGNNIAISEGNQRNTNRGSIAPYIDYFCNNFHFNDPQSCAFGLFDFIKDLECGVKAEYHVCGYNRSGRIPVPEFWYVNIKSSMVFNGIGDIKYGINFCAANEYFSQYADILNKGNIFHYSLQDAVDVSLFAIEMSMKLERFIDRDRLISPPIDLLAITQSGVKWIQQKALNTGGGYGSVC